MTAWTDVIGWTLVHFVWQGAAIALTTAMALRLLRRASAHARYLTACAALLVALAAAPLTMTALLTSAMPTWGDGTPGLVVKLETGGHEAHVFQASTVPVTGTGSLPVDSDTLASALSAFVACWVAGVLFLTARLASGWWRVRRLHTAALLSPASDWLATANRLAGRLGLFRDIHVVDSYDVDTPTVIGWLQPVVLLPIAALTNLTPAQVQAILAHELAHIRRHDFVVNLLQTVAETVLFYHPAVWWLSARIRDEREHCCDDIAVQVCGDPVGYAEALTTIAAWGQQAMADASRGSESRLAVAATSGSLLNRVRRLLRLPDERGRRRPAAFLLAATVLLVLAIGTRLVIVAQSPAPFDAVHTDRRLGPQQINRILGFDLFPGPVQYPADDPLTALAWDVKVAYPGGEMSFMGFTARGLIRYAYALDRLPIMDGPAWLDGESHTIRAETSTPEPTDLDYREAIRVALEAEYGVSLRRETRLFPVYGLQPLVRGRLGPNIRSAAVDCVEDLRARPGTVGPSLHARGQVVLPFCGVDNTITGVHGRRATFEQLARSLRGFNVAPEEPGVPAREVVDQTGLTGVYDFDVDLGFLPFAVIATAHPTLGVGFGPMIRTFPQAFEEQLGLRLVPSDAPRDVAVIVSARQQLEARAAQVKQEPASQPAW
jgi:uncharacterized protein (TIGR03435 family)